MKAASTPRTFQRHLATMPTVGDTSDQQKETVDLNAGISVVPKMTDLSPARQQLNKQSFWQQLDWIQSRIAVIVEYLGLNDVGVSKLCLLVWQAMTRETQSTDVDAGW